MLKNILSRAEPALRILCLALAALLLVRFAFVALRFNPLKNAKVPAIPTLANTTNYPLNTNAAIAKPVAQTNTIATVQTNVTLTNAIAAATNKTGLIQTNPVAIASTNAMAKTNAVAKGGGITSPPQNHPDGATNTAQLRIERITQSEILAPVMHPPPMALLGIAGDDVFLRAPSGQTGMIKEGGELGGVKLLRIGINRVLVEEAGQKKELTMFSGFGSESLLSKEQENSK